MRVKSDQQLSEIDSKYSMFVQVCNSQPRFQGLSSSRSLFPVAAEGGNMTDPGNEVGNSVEHFD